MEKVDDELRETDFRKLRRYVLDGNVQEFVRAILGTNLPYNLLSKSVCEHDKEMLHRLKNSLKIEVEMNVADAIVYFVNHVYDNVFSATHVNWKYCIEEGIYDRLALCERICHHTDLSEFENPQHREVICNCTAKSKDPFCDLIDQGKIDIGLKTKRKVRFERIMLGIQRVAQWFIKGPIIIMTMLFCFLCRTLVSYFELFSPKID